MDPLDQILTDFLANAAKDRSSPETITLRHLVQDVQNGRFKLKLPYQRKHQWKLPAMMKWIKDLLLNGDPEGLSISRRAGINRCVNGANRIRSIVKYFNNEFAIEIGSYQYWFDAIPAEHAGGKKSKFQRVLTSDARDRLLNFCLKLSVRENLSDAEEIKWYVDMNANAVAHAKGHLLIANLFEEGNPFAETMLRDYPVTKDRVGIDPVEADSMSLGTFLAEKLGAQVDPNHASDIKEDSMMTIANLVNMLSNGKTYSGEWKGAHDSEVLDENEATFRAIFEGLDLNAQFRHELIQPSSKPFIPNAWNCSYLLGPITWSIGQRKPDVVLIWRAFLSQCISGTIADVYHKEVNALKAEAYAAKKYDLAWQKVSAHVGAI
jgi:hypothetical protein